MLAQPDYAPELYPLNGEFYSVNYVPIKKVIKSKVNKTQATNHLTEFIRYGLLQNKRDCY